MTRGVDIEGSESVSVDGRSDEERGKQRGARDNQDERSGGHDDGWMLEDLIANQTHPIAYA